MQRIYDPVGYWSKKPPPDLQAYPDQKEALLDIFKEFAPLGSVLEVGCGTGRVTQILAPFTDSLDVLDLNHENVKSTMALVPGIKRGFVGDLRVWEPEDEIWDTVVAIEVLMHIPPLHIESVFGKLVKASKRLITCDWTEPIEIHNWMYDYEAKRKPRFSARVGRQTAFVFDGGQ